MADAALVTQPDGRLGEDVHDDIEIRFGRDSQPEPARSASSLSQRESRRCHRSSIWRRTPDGWRVYFHQGTIIPPACRLQPGDAADHCLPETTAACVPAHRVHFARERRGLDNWGAAPG